MNSKRKGKAGELDAAHAVRRILGLPARRGQQRSGLDAADIVDAIPGTHCEVKRRKAISTLAFLRQAEHDAAAGTVPYVLMREDGDTRWCIMLRLDQLTGFANLLVGATCAKD
jgi:hypothetical protein